jgi:hypothetical protein
VDVASRDIADVVGDAHRAVAALSSGWPGLAVPVTIASVPVPWRTFAAGADTAIARVEQLRCTRSFSNVGATAPEVADWGECAAWRMFYAPAMTTMPWVTIAAQGLGASMWLSMRVHGRGLDQAGVDRLGAALIADADVLAGAPIRRVR